MLSAISSAAMLGFLALAVILENLFLAWEFNLFSS